MTKTEIISDKLPPAPGVFSQAMRIPLDGELIWVSGEVARDSSGNLVGEGDITVQTEAVLENIKHVLAEANATLQDVIKATFFIRNMEEHFQAIHDVRRRYFEEPFPASTMVEVSRLVHPGYLIEIEVVAYLPPGRP